MRKLYVALFVSIPAFVILSIWIPVLSYYHFSSLSITMGDIESARVDPPDYMFTNLGGSVFAGALQGISDAQIMDWAENILGGVLIHPELTGDTTDRIPRWNRVGKLPSSEQLFLQSFTPSKILLAAYNLNHDVRFLAAARDMVLDWDKYDRSTWIPVGLQWNDHAASERMVVICDLWGTYRNQGIYESSVAKRLLALAVRHASFLSDPKYYNYATNHGIMQNVALLYFCVMFPKLAARGDFEKVAVERLKGQMPYYLNGEGAILEHSPGYQALGLNLLGVAAYCMNILQEKVPSEWMVRYQKAKQFYVSAMRPDGTFPVFGDTVNKGASSKVTDETRLPVRLGDPINSWEPLTALSATSEVYPQAGFAFSWSGDHTGEANAASRQMALAWSYYPGHAHKHADELSINLWARGCAWWTNAGYWGYDIHGREYAEGWSGSNAPHLENEQTDSKRVSRLLSYSEGRTLSAYDVERQGPAGFQARRQVVCVGSNRCVVLDTANGSPGARAETCWTSSSELSLKQLSESGEFLLTRNAHDDILQDYIASSSPISLHHFYGSSQPFLGWIYADGTPKPAHTITVSWPADGSSVLNVWTIGKTENEREFLTSHPSISRYLNPEEWEVTLPTRNGKLVLERRQNLLTLTNVDSGAESSEELIPPPKTTQQQIDSVTRAFQEVSARYQDRKKDLLIDSRVKWSYGLICILLLQESFFWVYRKLKFPSFYALRITCASFWILGAIWLQYFRLI